MSTKTLLAKHADTLSAIREEAIANSQQASEELQQRNEEMLRAQTYIGELKKTMTENHRGFFGVARAILGMAYKRPEDPKEIDKVLEPIANYQAALAAIPEARNTIFETSEAVKKAENEMQNASLVLVNLNSMLKQAEDIEAI